MSCPHYLGEVVIYAGLALVAVGGRRTTAWLMLLWVVSGGRLWAHEQAGCTNCSVRSAGGSGRAFLVAVSHRCWPHQPAACTQVTNLSLAAGMTHRWYREHFKSYPRRRRALFPFLF